MLEVGDKKEYKVIAGKKLGSVKRRNQILLLRCQLELGQKHILNDIDYRDKYLKYYRDKIFVLFSNFYEMQICRLFVLLYNGKNIHILEICKRY